jgi:hypothetical protein
VACPQPEASGSRIWGCAEYLLWWVKGDRLPPLVTTSPAGTPLADAGILGLPSTTVLIGDSRVNDDVRSGGRFTLGTWLDCNEKFGISADFFFLESRGQDFAAASDGSTILMRPFFNTQRQAQDAEIDAFPGISTGRKAVSTSSEFLGADAFARCNVCCGCDYRIDALAGYRFLRLKEGLRIDEQVTSTSTAPDAPLPGTTFDLFDRFDTENRFHGGTIGVQSTWSRDRLCFDLLALVALGCTERTVTIDGSTTITVPGQGSQTFQGGLLALGTNSGRFHDQTFSVVPEVRLNVGYRLTEHMLVFVGYTFLYWTNVARPGEQVDLRVNPNFIPPPVGGGEPSPRFQLRESDLWVQGISFGVSFKF